MKSIFSNRYTCFFLIRIHELVTIMHRIFEGGVNPAATIKTKHHLMMSIRYQLFCIIFREGKHQSIATKHRDEVVGYFAKIDPGLADLVVKSTPKETADGSSKTNGSSSTKRKIDEQTDASPKKKVKGTNGSMTLSQREKRAMELLASYLQDRGGMLPVSLVASLLPF